MFYLLSLLAGIVVAFMVATNGSLSDAYGVFLSTVMIHIIGSAFALLILAIRRKKFCLFGKCPLWAYLGGTIGVLTTLFNNFAFGSISVTSIVALSLLGQTLTALCIDYFGILGATKQKFRRSSLIGFLFALGGIFLMIDTSSSIVLYAILLSFASGISIVLSRNVNATLAKDIGALEGSFMNHLTGLIVSTLILFLFGQKELIGGINLQAVSPIMFTGGALGVICVLLYNIVVPKIAAFHVTLLTFIGQVFMGLILDILMENEFSYRTIWGGILISLGVCINMILEHREKTRERIHS